MNNKKIIALGLLAGFFLMNKKEETPTNNNSNTGGGTGSGSFGGSSGGGPSAGGGGNTDNCTAHYLLNGIKVCETLLPDYGYFWWDGYDGAGWYSHYQFNLGKKAKVRGMTDLELLAEWTADAMNISSPNYSTARSNLRDAYLNNGGPLPSA